MNRNLLLVFVTLLAVSAGADAPAPQSSVKWRKTVVDPAFRSEGVAIADVNRDRKPDIIVGDYWYQAPGWERRPLRPPRTDLGDGSETYSDAFCCFVEDFNRDRWPDVLVIGFPGKAAYWYENPGKAGLATGNWKPHLAAASACNETPIYTDLFGNGKKCLVAATHSEGRMCWFAPSADPNAPWTAHPISAASTPSVKVPGTDVFAHGLGVGDVNGDGRRDVLVKEGWWEQPRDARNGKTRWTFHPADLGEDCADMYTLDLNGDKRLDVVSSSAHARGVWWHEQQTDGTFRRQTITGGFTQSHALNLIDVNGDGKRDLITGKRWWAHGTTGDVDPNAPPVLCWIEMTPGKNTVPRFKVHVIDEQSGIGTQFVTADLNGDKRVDVVVSNKRGVFLFEQVRRK